jgi:PTS system galactitol-specific IIA component
MNMEQLITTDLIGLKIDANDANVAIEKTGELLLEKGYIKKAYIDSVLKREEQFPTGIALIKSGIAIPHASPVDNVLKNGIAVLQLANPIVFYSMENCDETVEVKLVVMLALKDSNQHLDMLQKLFTMFQEESCIDLLLNSRDKEEVRTLIVSKLKN